MPLRVAWVQPRVNGEAAEVFAKAWRYRCAGGGQHGLAYKVSACVHGGKLMVNGYQLSVNS